MTKFRNRLTVIFILFIGLSNVAAGIFAIAMFRDAQADALQRQLQDKLELYLENFGLANETLLADKAAIISEKLDAQVTFFDQFGQVLADSEGSSNTATSIAWPPEIVQAKQEGMGVDVRSGVTAEQRNVMYVAIPVDFGLTGDGYVRLGESMTVVETQIASIRSWFLVGMLCLLVVTAVIAYRLSQLLTRPIEKMTRVAYQIANMNYKARVNIPNRDEIGQLGQAINKMSESLQFQLTQFQENENRLKSVLDNMTSGIIMIGHDERIVLINRSAEQLLDLRESELLGQSFTKLKSHYELTKMIQACLEKHEHIRDEVVFYFPEERIMDVHLAPMTGVMEDWGGIVIVLHDISAIRRLERVRSEFVANVSHELKTPIAAVKGFAETLLGGAMNDAQIAKSFLQIIHDESERLNRLIGDILDLNKIESKRVPLHFSPIELKPFIDQVFHIMSAEAQKKRIRLEASVPSGIYMEADEDRLRQILINLLSNGITYSYDEGWVRVGVELIQGATEEHEHVRITVEDAGIGIPRKDLPRIFERFYRVDKARTRSSGGTGLGLSIVKHLVEMHKGFIRVDSQVGVGTRFYIDLPVLQ
jgi:two-component system phosphate regulon sensor histidine kinase PhoR